MRTILLTALALVVATSLQAKNITWHQGSVVLTDRHVVAGEIARLSTDLLLHRSATGEVTTYPAHKVASFRYHDHAEDINRQFISVATRTGVAKSYRFYERVVLGKLSVLRIQQSFNDLIDETNPDNFDFFIEKERVVCSIKQFRKKYFDQVKQELDAQFVSYHGLDPNTRLGAVSLIILYNQATSASQVASLN